MQKGEVWLYKDLDTNRIRPCVIMGNRGFITDTDWVIAKMTSHPPRNEFDVQLELWERYKLKYQSTVRCSKLFTIKEENLLHKVGFIDIELDTIKVTIAKYIMED